MHRRCSRGPRKASGEAQSLRFGKISLASAQCLLSCSEILNIDIRSVPPDDRSVIVTLRSASAQKPSIFAIETPEPGFGFVRAASADSRLPFVHKNLNVIGMYHRRPTLALRFSERKIGVRQPTLIVEFVRSVR